MAAFSSNNIPSLGTLNLPPYFELPRLPAIIAEWAAIIPLVCHLASHRHDYKMAGEIALRGTVSLGLFPRLGVLHGLSRLLKGGLEFVDKASAKGGATCTVWDVQWGSVFPCANGAASDMVKHVFRSRADVQPQNMPREVLDRLALGSLHASVAGDGEISENSSGVQGGPARRLADADVTADASKFLFGSRTVMIGAIEKFGGCGRFAWMDTILVPHPRRDAWLKALSVGPLEDTRTLCEFDQTWILNRAILATWSADLMRMTVMRQTV